MIFPQGYDTWLTLDIEWLSVCDCLLRLPGESKGADIEVEYAREHMIPVFYTIEQLIEYYTDLADED
jgi:4-hydroxy-3-methylbut-2-en-1-yl diphosphate synthase IspG/GcpE